MPGQVVDSSTTSWPSRSTAARRRAAPSTIERSGSRWRESGVGSAIRIASRLAQLLVARRRVDEAALDERGEAVARDVVDVRLAAVEGGDDVLEHVDEEDAAAGLRERGRERHPDVAGADDGDVVVSALSHGRQG